MSDLTWYVIYKTTHVETDQFYVGRHQTTDLNDGYQGSGNWVRSFEDTSVLVTEIIEYCENAEHLREREQYYIELWFDDPLCMNESRFSDGGLEAGSPVALKIGETQREIWKDPQKRRNLSKTMRKIWTPEKRAEFSEARKGIPKTQQHRDSIAKALTGHHVSTETRAAIASAWTDEMRDEASVKRKGISLDADHREAISDSKAQHWLLTVIATGREIPVHNLTEWCHDNGYNRSQFGKIARGRGKSHRGLTCRKVTKEEYQQLVDQLASQGNSPS